MLSTVVTLILWTPLALLAASQGAAAVAGSLFVASLLSAVVGTRFLAQTRAETLISAVLTASICLLMAIFGGGVVAAVPGAAALLTLLAIAGTGGWLGAHIGASFRRAGAGARNLSE